MEVENAKVGEIEYAIRSEDGSGSYGYATAEEAKELGIRSASMWVAEHGGECILRLLKVETLGVLRVRYDGLRGAEAANQDAPRAAAPANQDAITPGGDERVSFAGLVAELKNTADRIRRADESVRASCGWAADLYNLVSKLGFLVSEKVLSAKIGKDAALEADGAKKPGGVGGIALREGGAGTADADGVECGAFLRLLNFFAIEFIKLVLEISDAEIEGGDIIFKRSDSCAAEVRANALQELAARLDKTDDGKDGFNCHEAIISYMASRKDG